MNKTIKNLAIKPTQCHLWQQKDIPDASLINNKEYNNHFMTDADEAKRSLKQCSDCNQLYLYEFLEWIDWDNGNDPQYRTFIPVATVQDADEIAKLSQFEILTQSPRYQIDFPKSATYKAERWII